MNSKAAAHTRVRKIGSYLLGRRIGAGGMAAVFAAQQQGPLDLGRLVAIKVMSTALVGDPKYERLFIREAGVSTRLEHPNVVRVYEVGEADGTLFISMEFVHGATLAALIADQAPPLSIALGVIADVAEALHAAHELRDPDSQPLSLVHQDVSPHNIMVTYNGVSKLLDFGVARIGALDASHTETIRGKPSYLAPEQIEGRRIDRRTDIFALGVVLYELLTGTRLFGGSSNLEIYAKITAKAMPRLGDDIPSAIATVCHRALNRTPAKRFNTAAEFATALRRARKQTGIPSISKEQLGGWASTQCPPAFSIAELEREIRHGSTTPTGPSANSIDVADLSTIREDLPATPMPSHSTVGSRQVSLNAAGGRLKLALGAVVAIAIGYGIASLNRDAPSSAPPSAETSKTSAVAIPLPPTVSASPAPTSPDTVDASRVPTPTLTTTARVALPPQSPPQPPIPITSSTVALPPPSAPPAPPATPPSASEPVVQPARLAIHSNIWGTVFVDGAQVGFSPLKITTTAGLHSVLIITKDGSRQQRSVRARAGQETVISFKF